MDAALISTHHDGPADRTSAERLAAGGLTLRIVANDDRAGFDGWFDAVSRGFLDGMPTDTRRDAAFERLSYRRLLGVYDAAAPQPEVPVGTFATWLGELTVPGGAALPACAMSSVTVSGTHRRRGIARAMMEAELRWSVAQGLPIAVLTVTESTLYGRYGFAPAAAGAHWLIDTRRAGWVGPIAGGRVDYISREQWVDHAARLHQRVRTRSAGELEMPPGHWARYARTGPDATDPGKVYAIQYADPDGVVRGVAAYTVEENPADHTASIAHVSMLVADGTEAYAGLWRFLLQLDLVGSLRASELAVDEPLLWMIADQRAATVTVTDHQYVRILDVVACLQARRYAGAGGVVLDVSDPLGFATGLWRLSVDDAGRGTVTAAGPDDSARAVRLGVRELSAVYLGGVSLATLADAGLVAGADQDVDAAARLFGWHRAPRQSFWY